MTEKSKWNEEFARQKGVSSSAFIAKAPGQPGNTALFAAHLRCNALSGLRPEMAPASLRRRLEQCRRWIHRKGAPCYFQHGQVVNRVAKHRIGRWNAHALQCGRLSFVRWHVDNFAGDEA